MKAVIMAGGEGTRLRPLTSLLPKPMVPIVNQPVMEHIVGLLKHHGITDIIATLAFMPQVIQDYFGDGEEWGVSMGYTIEETPLGTAGSIKNAERLLPRDEPFIVISGDALTDIDLGQLLAFHREKGGAVTLALKVVPDPLEFGVVITSDDGRIERFVEKPTWGQVFSDRINTGIYVIEPWVLDEIPQATPYDFSSELFPKLMQAGHALYGAVVDGYWCDVGGRESYLDVHHDILDGRSKTYVPGIHAREGLWIAESAVIESGAVLGDKVVVGENTRIRSGAVVGDYAVIGDNCVISENARVSHSVVWDDTFVGPQAVVAGAIVCRHVDIRARAVLDAGASVGSESVIGRDAHIGSDVQVFPYKRVEPAAYVNSSIIWEPTGGRSLFGDAGVTGLVGIDITAELALNLAEAYGTLLPKGSPVVVSRDASRPARMVKRAMISGLNAAGTNVRDLRVSGPAVSRFTTQKTRCLGGIHVAMSRKEPQSLEIRFFDRSGLDLPAWEQKKIERLYFRGEFRRAFFDDIGEIVYPPRPLEYYVAALDAAIEDAGLGGGWRKVVADMGFGAAALTFPLVAHSWQINLVGLNPVIDSDATVRPAADRAESVEEVRRGMELFGADVGVIFDHGAERVRLVTPKGRLLDLDTQLHAMVQLWCRARAESEGAIAVPVTASRAVEQIAAGFGREVIRPGRSRRALAQAVMEGRAVFAGGDTGGYLFGDFFPAYDGVLSVGMLVRMLAHLDTTLDDVVQSLPPFFKRELPVFCPVHRKGAVMRAVSSAAVGLDADFTEGVLVEYPDGWVLVLPDVVDAEVAIHAEAYSAEAAARYAAEWREVVAGAIAEP